MLTIRDSIAGDPIKFHYCEDKHDVWKAWKWAERRSRLALDTESTAVNCYRPGWQLRTFQFGHANESFVVPAKYKDGIEKILTIPGMFWIGHNGPHDIRSLDVHLGLETGVVCKGETYIPSHHADSRNAREGGINHGLKDQTMAFIDGSADKWEKALKAEFKRIEIPIPGEFYKSSNRATGRMKGDPKVRKAKLSEGWGLIDPTNLAYIAYAASDPVLTYRLWLYYQQNIDKKLYKFDHRIQQIGDRLQRRAIKLDVRYTTRFREALDKKAQRYTEKARSLGCDNIYSPDQLAQALLDNGGELSERTPTGKYKTDDKVLRAVIDTDSNSRAAKLARTVLVAKRVSKRREAYADAMLREMDADGRVHPSINTLAARTTRMSISNPALQQLPTKEREIGKD